MDRASAIKYICKQYKLSNVNDGYRDKPATLKMMNFTKDDIIDLIISKTHDDIDIFVGSDTPGLTTEGMLRFKCAIGIVVHDLLSTAEVNTLEISLANNSVRATTCDRTNTVTLMLDKI